MSVVDKWHGATVRSGVFDDQNGIYWEYDGVNLQCCQRSFNVQVQDFRYLQEQFYQQYMII